MFTCNYRHLKSVISLIDDRHLFGGTALCQDGSIIKFKIDDGNISLSMKREPECGKEEFEFPEWMGEHPRVNSPWPDTEESELLNGYRNEKLTIEELCKKHGRKEGGIISHLEKWYPELREAREKLREIEKLEGELTILCNRTKNIENRIAELKK